MLRETMKHIAGALSSAADLVMPRECICCSQTLERNEKHICRACLEDLPKTRYWVLRENPMAERYNDLVQRGMGDNVRFHPYGYATALYFYRGGFRNISKALKYHRNFAAGRYFADQLGLILRESPFFRDVTLVVPIPLHWTRRWLRGYNQAEIISRKIARALGVPCCPGMLVREHLTRSQTHLSQEERARNVAGAFRLGDEIPPSVRPGAFVHILLVDDVFTSGATVASAHLALLRGLEHRISLHNLRISLATLACVER